MRAAIQTFVLTTVLLTGCGDKQADGDTGALDEEGAPAADGGEEAAVDGEEVYALHCAMCHGEEGTGVSGPDLTSTVPGYSDTELMSILQDGIGGMVAPNLTPAEENGLLDYLRSEFGAHNGG